MVQQAPPPQPTLRPAAPARAPGVRDLLAELLAEQQSLSAVDHFARWHENHSDAPQPSGTPHTPRYRNLLPATPPGPGQQYAFEVDLDSCSGCKACVTACHSLNGLDPGESWRRVGQLVPTPTPSPKLRTPNSRLPTPLPDLRTPISELRSPLPKLPSPLSPPRTPNSDLRSPIPITTACHHCVEPACLHGCPVLAYDKDPRTGIVRHLDDQCIGCSYCTLMCPYEVPQYSKRLGIVRKCDLCQGRLAVGEAPACAQACPGDAIRVTLVETEEVRSRLAPISLPHNAAETNAFLPDSPDPALSLPTTRYRSNHLLGPDLRSATAGLPTPAHAHAPLGVMLVLTQFSLGAFIVDGFHRWQAPPTPGAFLALAGTALLGLGLAAGTSHLGRPAQAWRSFLGWRTSWLSREIIALNLFLFAAVTHAAEILTRGKLPGIPTAPITSLAAVLAGLIGVYTSARVYTATRRGFWSPDRVFPDFLGTVVLASLGFALTQRTDLAASIALAVAIPTKIAFELLPLAASLPWPRTRQGLLGRLSEASVVGRDLRARRLFTSTRPPAPAEQPPYPQSGAAWIQRSTSLLSGPLRPLLVARIAFAGIALTTLLVGWIQSDTTVWPWVTWVALLTGELLARRLFFRAAVPDRMPGVA